MANTTSDKLLKLLSTKGKIRASIIEAGVAVPSDTTFNEYNELIKQIPNSFIETTPLEDLMVIVDMHHELVAGHWEEHTYTQEEQQELLDLIDLILEGE